MIFKLAAALHVPPSQMIQLTEQRVESGPGQDAYPDAMLSPSDLVFRFGLGVACVV
jgi:hypothetical protein